MSKFGREKLDAAGAQKRRPSRRFHGRVVHEDGRTCDWPGCEQPGEFKAAASAPRRSDEPPQWNWYCLEHVRAHNERWNYFESLSPEDYAKARNGHPSWDRQTYPFQMNPDDLANLKMRDGLGIFSSDPRFARFRSATDKSGKPMASETIKAFAVLGLSENASMEDIKTRYKALLKQYHPDANGGDRRGEKRMQAVIAAYHQLMES